MLRKRGDKNIIAAIKSCYVGGGNIPVSSEGGLNGVQVVLSVAFDNQSKPRPTADGDR